MIDPQILSLYSPISNIQTLRLNCIKEWDLGERSGETHQSRGHQGTWADGRWPAACLRRPARPPAGRGPFWERRGVGCALAGRALLPWRDGFGSWRRATAGKAPRRGRPVRRRRPGVGKPRCLGRARACVGSEGRVGDGGRLPRLRSRWPQSGRETRNGPDSHGLHRVLKKYLG